MPTGLDKSEPQSLILDIHGGGFTSGDKSDDVVLCQYYASKGFIVVAMNYTYLGVDGASLNSMTEEALQCVEAAKKQCASMGYDVTEMATTGGSAGGALAMLYAYRYGSESPIPVKFVFQQTGPAAFGKDFWGNASNADPARAASLFTGKNITPEMVESGEYQKSIDEISPAAIVTQDSAPTLCAYGPKDKIVPPKLKFLLLNSLKKNRVPYDYSELLRVFLLRALSLPTRCD